MRETVEPIIYDEKLRLESDRERDSVIECLPIEELIRKMQDQSKRINVNYLNEEKILRKILLMIA